MFGVIGERKAVHDLCGDPVNLARRTDWCGEAWRIHVNEAFARANGAAFAFCRPCDGRGQGRLPGSLRVARGINRAGTHSGPATVSGIPHRERRQAQMGTIPGNMHGISTGPGLHDRR